MRFQAARRFVGVAGLLAWSGCAPATLGGPNGPETAGSTGIGGSLRLATDPTVQGARFLPIAVPHESFGAEPGGGVRSIESGVRVVSLPGGAMVAARDRFGAPPSQVLALPERLGGGFLFVVGGSVVWRAERWLGTARPLYVAPSRIGRLVPGHVLPGLVAGLDRVYVQTEHDVWHAIDGARGVELPLGPWPASPSVGAYVAADGWRAIATADLRGTVATFDAGATWRPFHVPPDERETRLLADVSTAPDPSATPAPSEAARASGDGVVGGPLGARPLVAAVEDGWPLVDGTAVVARDGALARVRLDDGAIQSLDASAYDLRSSRCHAMALARAGGGAGVGFACGEPHGSTVVYALDLERGRMAEDRRFDVPRVVLPAGNGAVSVRGSCDAHAKSEEAGAHAYCIRGPDGEWRETRLTGAIDADAPRTARGERQRSGDARGGAQRVSAPIREHVVALSDGRLALVWPPSDLAAARLMLIDGTAVRSLPLALPETSPDVRRALEDGLWLDGFEERRAGVLGGWISSGGSMLGIEIGLDGAVRFGAYVRDAGARIVSGRYGLGWTKGHVGLETTDGGMTWTAIDGPAPIDESAPSAACGPVGCEVAGWLRIGWHEAKPNVEPSIAPSPGLREPVTFHAPIALSCNGLGPSAPGGRDALSLFPVFAAPPPTNDEARYTFHAVDLREARDLDARTAAVARVQAWGPKGGDWERAARWTVQWASPFAGADDAHTTLPSPVPSIFSSLDRIGPSMAPSWMVAAGDDPAHALLVAQASGRDTGALALFEVEADHAPLTIRAPENDPFGRIDAALRAGGRWYVASHVQPNEAIVWRVDGPSAHELARLPRWFDRGRAGAPTPRLAWRTDGRALGFVVDGGPTSGHGGTTRWVASIDLDSGAVGDVELLGSADLSDAESLGACADGDGDESKWRLDAPLPGTLAVEVGPAPGVLSGMLARGRLAGPHPCIERLAGRLSLPHLVRPSQAVALPNTASRPAPRNDAHSPRAVLTLTATRDDKRDAQSIRCSANPERRD